MFMLNRMLIMMCIVLAGCFGGNEKQEWIEDFTECEYYSGSEGWERVEGFKMKHGDHDGFNKNATACIHQRKPFYIDGIDSKVATVKFVTLLDKDHKSMTIIEYKFTDEAIQLLGDDMPEKVFNKIFDDVVVEHIILLGKHEWVNSYGDVYWEHELANGELLNYAIGTDFFPEKGVGEITYSVWDSGDKSELKTDTKNMDGLSDRMRIDDDTQVDLAYDAIVKMETNMGTILIDLYEDRAPKHSANFKKLANEGAFNDTYFHRVIPNFIVQGGDPLTRDNTNRQDDGTGGIGGNIPPEIGQPHLRGTLAAARDNNPEKKSNGSQFYFCLADLPNLDGEYTVFGKIVQGMDIVDEMGSVKTDRRDNPREAIIILNTEVIRK